MPKSESKKPSAVKPPSKQGRRRAYLLDHMKTIKVTLLDAPTTEQMNRYLPGWTTLTWSDCPGEGATFDAMAANDAALKYMLRGQVLPTALECVTFVFLFEGLSQIDATHILRHRRMTFSGQSTDARDCRDDPFVMPPEFVWHMKNGTPLGDKIRKLHQASLDLYIEMVEHDDVMREHARYVLPRSSMTALYVKCDLQTAISFIKTRLDRSTQPMSDNVIAALMLLELAHWQPEILTCFDLDLDPVHPLFLKSVQTPVAHALHPPEGNADCFEWCDEDFISSKKKSEYEGAGSYFTRMQQIREELQRVSQSQA